MHANTRHVYFIFINTQLQVAAIKGGKEKRRTGKTPQPPTSNRLLPEYDTLDTFKPITRQEYEGVCVCTG